MPLIILSDRDVRELLDTLTKDDVQECHKALADALHAYSTANGPADSGCCASNQPKRITIKQRGGVNTLFMPSTSGDALGVKVLTLAESSRVSETASDVDSLRLSDSESVKSSARDSSSQSSFSGPSRSSTASTTSSTMQGGSSTSRSSVSSATTTSSPSTQTHPKLAENIHAPLGLLEPSEASPKGCLTVLDTDGRPRGLINASTLTAFRTALASTLILKARQNVHTVTVFGAGLQAYWHIFLSVLLKKNDIHHIHVINRDFKRAQRLLMTLAQSENDVIADAMLGQKLRPSILTPEFNEYSRLLKEHVRNADIIYCCTPSTEPLFPAGHLTNPDGRKKARYIAAIGSYKPHMQELHHDIFRQAVRGPEESSHSHLHIHHRHAHEGGAVIVDSIDGAMREAGEIIRAGISGQGLVEIGEIVMLKRSHWAEKAEREAREREERELEAKSAKGNPKSPTNGGHGLGHLFRHSSDKEKDKKEKQADDGLQGWLERGNVLYKSVGM